MEWLLGALWSALWWGPVELQWDAPPECPSQAEVADRIADYVQAQPSDRAVHIEATVSRIDDVWHLRLVTTIGDSVDRRELSDEDCRGLAEFVAVSSAIAALPERDPTVPETPPLAVPEPPQQTTVERVEPAPAPAGVPLETKVERSTSTSSPRPLDAGDVTPRSRSRTRISARAVVGASLGWLPPGADVGLMIAAWWRWIRLELGGVYSPRRRVRFADLPTAGADVSGWAVTARGCGLLGTTPWLEIPMCAGVEAGQVRGRPVGLLDGKTGTPAWIAAVVAPSLRFVVHERLALWLSPELQIGLTRPTLDVAGDDAPLFRSTPIAGRFHGGIELTFR